MYETIALLFMMVQLFHLTGQRISTNVPEPKEKEEKIMLNSNNAWYFSTFFIITPLLKLINGSQGNYLVHGSEKFCCCYFFTYKKCANS